MNHDPMAELAELRQRLVDVERMVRQPPDLPMHALADARRLARVQQGEVPVWSKERGGWIPGTAGDFQSIWSHPAAVAVAIGQRYYHPSPGEVKSILVSLDVAGTSTTTVVVNKNTTTIATISLAAGQEKVVVAVTGVTLLADIDYLRAETTAAGDGALRLGVQARIVAA